MTVLGLLLLTLGVADLVRVHVPVTPPVPEHPRIGTGPARDADPPMPSVWKLLRSPAATLLTASVFGWGAGLPWGWIAAIVVASLAWFAFTTAGWWGGRTGLWPLVGLVTAVGAVLALGRTAPEADGWLTRWYADLGLDALAGVPFERFALVAGYLVFLIASANVVVRMVLAGAHVPVETEKTLKGGRVLGPIERVFIFATALSGQFVALGAIVAAKGIVRFPELQNDQQGTKAEYVLVGSFVSWAIALVLVPLL